MPCEHYKDALIEAAASGATPSGELCAHLAACVSCSDAFGEEQSLFAAIDSGLHAVNAEVPTSLVPRVRAGLNEAATPQLRWVQRLVFASVSVALAFVIFLAARPHRTGPENVAKQGPILVPTPVRAGTNTNPEKVPAADIQIASARAHHSGAMPNSTNLHSAASSKPEVLVPPDEREGLARLAATLSEHRDLAAAFLAQRAEKKDVLVTVDPLQIEDIEIKPLEGSETETSDGAGEK